MKKLLLAVLVLNLVIWLWGRRETPAIIDGLMSPDIGVVRLVDEAAVPRLGARSASQPESAAQPQHPAAASELSPGDTADRVVLPAPAADSDAPAPAAAAPVPADAAPTTESPVDGQPVSEPALATPATTVQPPGSAAETSVAAMVAEGRESLSSAEAATTRHEPPGPPPRELGSAATWLETDGRHSATRPSGVPRQAPEAPATAAGLVSETPAVPGDVEPAPGVVDARRVCETVGPFAQRALAEAFIGSQPTAVAFDGIREERVARPPRHWVLGPAQPSREAVAAYLSALQSAGVKDAWRAQSGVYVGRLVVGVFSTEENARRHAAMLAGKGVATEIRKQQAEETRWWADLRRDVGEAGLADVPDNVQVRPRDCARVAAP